MEEWMKNIIDVGDYWYHHVAKIPAFETFIIPKDFTVYHGGGALKANVEYPIGRPYYNPIVPGDPRSLTNEQRKILRNTSIPESMEKTYIQDITKQYIEHAFFGSYSTAIAYSKTVPECGVNCVGVYKFREQTPIIDMADAGNIHSLLFYPNNLDQTDREFLAEAYGITSLNPDERNKFWVLDYNTGKLNFIRPVRKSLRNAESQKRRHPYRPDKPEYFIFPKLIAFFSALGYKGFASPRTEDRMSEFILFNPIELLRRDLTNPIDWQQEPDFDVLGEIGRLIKSMKAYDTTNIDFHAGDLYGHSVWVALNVQKWLLEDGNKWTENIKSDTGPQFKFLAKLVVISAFLHDIGKMGGLLLFYDKPDHPLIGSQYLTGEKALLLQDNSVLNVEGLFSEILPEGVDQTYSRVFIIGIVRLHWVFGNILRQVVDGSIPIDQAAEMFEGEVFAYWSQWPQFNGQKDIRFLVFISSLMVISACDVLGSQVFIAEDLYRAYQADIAQDMKVNVNMYLIDYEYIRNSPKKHRGGQKFEDFRYDTVGYDLYSKVYANVKSKIQN